MRNRIFLFNPENDINLAYRTDVPRLSQSVRSLRSDGSLLPLWYSGVDDFIIAPDYNNEWVYRMSDLFGVSTRINDFDKEYVPAPWGWSHQVAREYLDFGITVPDSDSIECIRQLSHRRASIIISNELGVLSPVEAFCLEDVISTIAMWGDIYIKAPWSSSGRGVFRTSKITEKERQAVNSIIRRQGSVLVEPAHNKAMDFAMLFYSDDGRVQFKGLSMFATSSTGAYLGNFVGSDDCIIEKLAGIVSDIADIDRIKGKLSIAIEKYLGGNYTGWLGVDMLVTDRGDIIPCVELNLRMTMGVVAWYLRQHVAPDRSGFFTVIPRKSAIADDFKSVNGLIESGTLNLVPVTANTKFDFRLTVNG